MRFEAIRVRNLGPFKTASVDLGRIDGQLIAVTGCNGVGKSSLLELLAGGLFRACPTRGTLASLATARDAMVEVTVCNGQRYTVRQLVDGVSGKGETLILGPDGAPVVESGKLRDADRWIAEHFPTPEVLYSSSFAPQGQRGFLDLSPSERKKLLVQLLGLERYERMAEAARERAKAARGALDVLRARVADVPTPNLDGLRGLVDSIERQLTKAVEQARAARQAHERAKQAAGDAARAAELAEQRQAVEARLKASREQAAAIETRIANNRDLLDRADEIRGTVSRAAELEAEAHAAREAAAVSKAQQEALRERERSARTALADARAKEAAAAERARRAALRLADRERVIAAVAELSTLREREQALDAGLQRLREDSERLSKLMIEGKDQRITGLRQGLTLITECLDEGAPFQSWSQYTLEQDDALALEAASAPSQLRAVQQLVKDGTSALALAHTQLSAAERLAARLDEMEAAAADFAAAGAEQEVAAGTVTQAIAALDAARAELAEPVEDVGARLAALLAARAALEPTIALRQRLDQAEARIEELTASLVPVRETIAQAERELAALPAITVESVDLSASERAVTEAEAAEHSAREALARAKAAVEQAQETLAKRAELLDQVHAHEDELADWTRLAQDLGRDGLQALELDAALPEITAIANDLLHACHGSRFTIELRSTRLDASGKRELEALEFRVIDTVKGRDADASTYSGGECVICGEAVSLALTVLACRRAGIDRPTLVRDESGAALDAENGRAYVAMLRRAAKQLGADRVLYVSHTPELQQLADARIVVADGKVEVE